MPVEWPAPDMGETGEAVFTEMLPLLGDIPYWYVYPDQALHYLQILVVL